MKPFIYRSSAIRMAFAAERPSRAAATIYVCGIKRRRCPVLFGTFFYFGNNNGSFCAVPGQLSLVLLVEPPVGMTGLEDLPDFSVSSASCQYFSEQTLLSPSPRSTIILSVGLWTLPTERIILATPSGGERDKPGERCTPHEINGLPGLTGGREGKSSSVVFANACFSSCAVNRGEPCPVYRHLCIYGPDEFICFLTDELPFGIESVAMVIRSAFFASFWRSVTIFRSVGILIVFASIRLRGVYSRCASSGNRVRNQSRRHAPGVQRW